MANTKITADVIEANAVLAVSIADENITSAKLADLAVTEGKIANSAITAGKIATDAVITAKIQNGAITSAKLDTNIAIAGTLTTTGEITANGGIALGDNDKAIFGTGSDLEIFHNGTTSFIRDVGDGDLQIFATDDVYIRGYATNNYMARFNENGAVTLYHNNSSKFATTSTGIDVTGTATMDGLTVDGTGAEVISVNSTADGSQIAFDSATTSSDWLVGISNDATDDFLIYQSDAGTGDIRLYTDATERLTVLNGGNVGIGTASPSVPLEVNVSGAGDVFKLTRDTGTNGELNIDFAGGITNFNSEQGGFTFETSSVASAMAITAAGNVGIGTSSPQTPWITGTASTLSVVNSAKYTGLDIKSYSTSFNHCGAIALGHSKSATINTQAATTTGDFIGTVSFEGVNSSSAVTAGAYIATEQTGVAGATYIPSALKFATSTGSAAAAERMRIDSSGNVGIGTSSPSSYPVAPELVVDTGVSGGITVVSDSTSGGYGGVFFADGTTGNEQYRGFIQYNHNNSGSIDDLILGTVGTERLRIDSSGSVGIGTQAPAQPLHVLSSTALTAGVARFQYSGGNDYEVIRVESLGNNDAHIGFFADGDTNYYGGFGIDYSDAGKFKLQSDNLFVGGSTLMTWTRDGSVGIGTTSPAAGTNLDVQGNVIRCKNVYMGTGSGGSKFEGGNGSYEPSTGNLLTGAYGLNLNFLVAVTGVGVATSARVDSPTGDFYTNDGSISSLSDERVKTDINTLNDGLEIVRQLRPVTFKYSDTSEDVEGNKRLGANSDTLRYGFIAQEVERVAPQYVETGVGYIDNEEVDDFKSLSTTRMIPMLFKAIQEQQALIESLTTRLETLENA
jgi:hypothetical protein